MKLEGNPRRRAQMVALLVAATGLLWLVLCGVVLWPLAGAGTAIAVAAIGMLFLAPAVAFLVVSRHLTSLDDRHRNLVDECDRYRMFFNDANDVFFVCDPFGRFNVINRAGLELLGLDPVANRLSLFSVVAPEDAVQVSALAQSPETASDLATFAVELLTAEGARVPVQVNTRILRDQFGTVQSIGGVAQPVGDPKRSKRGARNRANQLRMLIEHLPEAIILLDHDGSVLLSNRPASDFLAEYGTFLADNRLLLFGGISIERLLERAAAMLRQEIVVREPYHQILEVTGQAFAEEDAIAGAVLIVRDVTAERQRRERLERSERLAAVGQLAAGIAHDFKNILQGIHLCAELSRSDPSDAAGHRDNMLTIIEQSERGSKLIQQIMDFTRQSESTQRLLDLGDLLEQTRGLLAPGIPESIVMTVEVPDGEFSVMADPGQIQQVVTNLVLNARDAMPDGGKLSVRLSEIGSPGDEGPVPIEVRDGAWLRITVADTGTGIPNSVQHRVFEPFFTTKRAGSGTGLGLAQVYGNVQQHGGHIDFETAVGIGTSFYVFLPAYRYHKTAAERGTGEHSCPRGAGQTVLVVEDELAVLTATAQSLRSLGYQVLEALDGDDALGVFREGRKVDLVLTDVRMPNMDGPTLAAEIKRLDPAVKVVMMTAYAPEAGTSADPIRGADALLPKPFSIDQLGETVHRTLVS